MQMIANRFSKIGSVPELEEADLKALLERVTDYIAHRTSDKVKIITHLPDLLPPVRLNVALFEWVRTCARMRLMQWRSRNSDYFSTGNVKILY